MIQSINDERRESLLALLEEGPKQSGELAGYLLISPAAAKRYLYVLEREAAVKRLGGRTNGAFWALRTYVGPMPVIVTSHSSDDGQKVEIPEEPQPPPPMRPVKSAKPLRQIPPTSATVTEELPWWATAERVGFSERCAAEARDHMLSSIGARQAPYRFLA